MGMVTMMLVVEVSVYVCVCVYVYGIDVRVYIDVHVCMITSLIKRFNTILSSYYIPHT